MSSMLANFDPAASFRRSLEQRTRQHAKNVLADADESEVRSAAKQLIADARFKDKVSPRPPGQLSRVQELREAATAYLDNGKADDEPTSKELCIGIGGKLEAVTQQALKMAAAAERANDVLARIVERQRRRAR